LYIIIHLFKQGVRISINLDDFKAVMAKTTFFKKWQKNDVKTSKKPKSCEPIFKISSSYRKIRCLDCIKVSRLYTENNVYGTVTVDIDNFHNFRFLWLAHRWYRFRLSFIHFNDVWKLYISRRIFGYFDFLFWTIILSKQSNI